LYPSGPVCAVSADACETDGQYMTPFELAEDRTAGITCYLCGPSDLPASVTKSGKGTISNKDVALDTLAIIGIVALVVCIITGFYCAFRCICRRRAEVATFKASEMDITMETEEGDAPVSDEGRFVEQSAPVFA
jgi:hypothetical protein